MQETTQNTVASYLSSLHLQRLHEHRERPGVEGFHGAVLLVDVVGFTNITRHFAESGARGAEQLSDVLNHVFGAIIDIIDAHGGDIQTFAGDAVMAVWPTKPENMEEAVTLAVQAARGVHDIPDHPARALQLRASVGCGPLRAFDVGGVGERWMLVTAGDPLHQVTEGDKRCQPGEVVVSTEAWAHLDRRCTGEMRSGNVIAVREVTLDVALPEKVERPQPTIDVEPYVLDVVHRRLTRGHGAYLAEFRTLTILFITLSDVDPGAEDALDKIHTAAAIMQRELDRTGGSVYQFLSDDKGTTLLGAYGLPGQAHEDDAVRGAAAAMAIREQLAAAGQRSATGVATGKLFCGSYGNDTRRSYAVVGTTINLSARLMQACDGDGLLCDEHTQLAVGDRGDFDELEAVRAKGIDVPVRVFRPTALKGRTHGRASTFVGRHAERAIVQQLLDASRGGDGGTLLIEGEAGIGKSELLRHLIREAADLRVIEGAADSIETTTSWLMWRAVVEDLLGADPRATLGEAVAGDERLTEWAPILNDVADCGVEDNETSAKIAGAARVDGIAELIVRLLAHAQKQGPVVLAVEDAHWLDSSSWSALRAATTKVPGLTVAISTRPIADPQPADYTAIVEVATEILLDSLSPEDAEALVCQRLGIESMPPGVPRVLREQAEGHPLYTEELAWSLVEQGAMAIEDGVARLAIGEGELATMKFPDSLQGVITSRIDRLPEESQLLLKVASVIGRVFSMEVLAAVNPVTDDAAQLETEVARLEKADLTKPERPKPDLAWIFKQALIQDTAYNLLVFKQRHTLHKAVADWYEATFQSSLASYYPVLAHHYSLAEVPEKTLEYLDLAGTRALRTGASAEAASFFERALDLDERVRKADLLRRARWHRSLGLAQYALGKKYEARASMLKTMALAGRPLAAGTFGLLLQLMGQYFWQAVFLAAPKALEAKDPQDRELAAEAADAAQYVSTTYYFDKENLPFFVAALMCATESARSGMTREAAVGLSYVGVIVGLFQIDKLHGTYFERGLAAAKGVGDPWAVARHWQLRAMQQAGLGNWIHQELEDSIEFFRKTGDRHEFEISLTVKALIQQYRAQFAASLKSFEEMGASAEGVSMQHMQWAKTQTAAIQLYKEGVAPDVLPLLDRSVEILEIEPEPPSEVMNLGARAEAVARTQGLEAAQPICREMWEKAKESPPNSHGGFLMYSFCIERTIQIWDQAAELGVDRAQAKKDMKFGFSQFGVFGFLFPFAKPRIAIYKARVARLEGKPDKAAKAILAQLPKAEAMDLKMCVGLGWYELAQCHPEGSTERKQWADKAAEQFASVGATHYEALARGI